MPGLPQGFDLPLPLRSRSGGVIVPAVVLRGCQNQADVLHARTSDTSQAEATQADDDTSHRLSSGPRPGPRPLQPAGPREAPECAVPLVMPEDNELKPKPPRPGSSFALLGV